MEKEKNEITSETKEGCVSEADMKHSGDDKPVLEALMLNVTTGHEGIIGKSEVVKEENNTNNLSLKKAEGEREVDEGVSSQDDNKDPTVDCHEVPADVHVQLEEKNVTVQSTKATPIGCIESKSDTAGVKNGEATEVTSTNDNALPTEDKVPVSTCQSSELSQAITSVGGSCNNGTSTLSTVSTTRSTRSQNPEFLARHRSFLHKLHLASSNNITDEELFTDDDESTTSKTTSRSSGSVQAEETSSLIVDSLTVRRKRERSASNGTLSPRIPSPSVSSMIGGSASANNSGSSSPAGSQMQPATKKRRSTRTDSAGAQQQQSPVATPLPAVGSSTDQFCWLCHKDGVVINCETCPRVYHLRCIQLEAAPTEDWVCPECITILHAENTDTRSRAMKLLSLDQLCNLLKYAVSRMKTYSGAEPFWKAVDVTEFPQYRDYVANPMDLSLLERNIKKRMYGSTEAFVADTKWILHNCIIFNTYQSRLTGIAKVLLKICKQEMSEIENCPDCYLNAHIRKDSWFIEVCRKPHILVWAKLKGFPFWPAKVMRTNKEGMVDVRFFGAHDRAWVPVRECFLYSKAIPASARNKKRNNLDACIEEVEQHTRKLREKFGVFEHAPFRTHFDPSREREQLHMLLPSYDDGGGQPSSKRSKLLGGGYTVRTYQRSQQSNREAQERKKIKTYETEELNATVERDKSVDRSSRTKKRNLWDGDGCSDNEKRASRSYKRTASGSSMSWQNSSTSSSNSSSSSSSEDSQESDDGTRQDGRSSVDAEGSGKSASLIEWSRFEESAAKLNAVVEGGGSDEDKQSITAENRKPRDGDDSRDSVLPCNDAKGRKEGTSTEISKVETSTSVPVEVVKKVLVSLSIADKLQEKLLRLQRSSKECKDAEDASSEGISETMSKEQKMENKTEKDSKSSEDCETSSVSFKENDGMKNFNLEMSLDKTRKPENGESGRDKNNDSSGSKDENNKRERSESPVVNKTPLRAEPKCYGNKYLPRVVLHNLVLPPGKILAGKIRGVTGNIVSDQNLFATKAKCFLLPAESKQDQKISPKEQHTCNTTTSVEDNRSTSCPESLLENRLEVAIVHETCTSHDSESSDQNTDVAKRDSSVNPEIFPCSLLSSHKPDVVGSDKVHVVQNCDPADLTKNVMSDNSSESGDGDIVLDSSKRTPEHGYSKCSFNDSFFENGANTVNSSTVQDTESSEQTEAVAEKDVELDGDQRSLGATEHTQEKGSAMEPAQEVVKESEALQSSAEESEAGSTVGTESLSKEVTASDVPPGDGAAVCGSQSKTVVISSSVSDSGNTDLNLVQNRSEGEPPTEEEKTSVFSGAHLVGKAAYQESDLPNKEATCTEDDREHSVSSSSSPNNNFDVSVKLSIPQTAVLKVYPAKTNKALDKKVTDSKMSELNKSEMLFQSDVTVTPTSVVSANAEKKDVADRANTTAPKETDGFTIIGKKIKEEPLDPDELVAESSSASTLTLSGRESLAKTSPELTQQKGAEGDKFHKGKIILNKKLTVSMLDDKDRLVSNDSPSSLSEKEGIFPSLFLDPSITITVINDKQSETAEAPVVGRSKVGSDDINVSELRASVNLSKDISLTVVGAGYDEHHSGSAKGLSGPVAALDMECDHESENDSCTSSTNASCALVPVTVQNSTTRQNSTNKQKKIRLSGGSETLQARSRARKSFPNRPIFTNLKGKSHPELVNGVGSFSNKSSTQRRNSAGTNSNSSDSRRSSYATSPQEMLISTQQSGDAIAENFGGSDNNNNTAGSAMVVLPPMLGNPTTNHIQALRAVNSNIGSPSHIVNSGSDMIPSRMMQVPHSQTHPVGSGTKISPAGQGSVAPTGTSRMPPQLQPRPPGPLLSQHPPSVPSEAGPMSAELNRHAHKLSDLLRTTVEEILRDLSNIGSPAATIKSLQIELEKQQWRHNQEMAEMKHNTDLIVMEMRGSMESERQRAIAETIRQCELEKQRAVEETKKKQWCTNCGKEALFYCCWNTSYCDYPCQQRHWPHHMSTCAQNTQQGGDGSVREGDMVQRSSPQTSGGSSNHNKPIPSQQQQKLHQVVSNGPIGGKPPVGPPPSYSGTVLAQTQRNVGASVGRVPAQYAGLLPMARPANIQGPHMLPTYAMYPGDPRGAGLAALQQQHRLMGSQFPPRHPHMGFTVRPPHYFL